MRKLALSGVLALGCLFWTALTPQQIAVNSAVFGAYSDYQLETANTYLLASIAGIAINPANILSNAAGFGAYSDRQLQEAQTYLLSQISTTGGLPANAAGALTNDGVGNIGWLAGIGGSSGSGLPGTNQIIARGSTQNTNWVSETPAGLVETNSNGGSVTLSNGTIVVNGPAGVNGNITLNDSAGGLELASTNGGLWVKNGITSSGATNSSLTASRVKLTDANKGEASAAASGAVPINADGSATTGAQGQALGYVLTNDSRALTLSGTNYWHGNNVWDGAQEIFSNSLAITGNLNTTNGVNQITNTSAANQGITLDPTKNYSLFSAGAFGVGTTGWTNTAAAQFNYANLQFSTNCGWGGVQSNGTANSTLILKGFEEFVISMGNTIVQLGDATTNLGHHIAITCGSAGTNAITTVSSQKIAGLTKWTNTAIFTCTHLISDGANWQICGTRGN